MRDAYLGSAEKAGTMNYSLITVEGNIGAGKTTLARKLSGSLNGRLLEERFSDNPFLPRFYEDPRRYGFALELFFLAERHKQLRDHLAVPDLFARTTICDYLFTKSLLFAKINLDEEEFRLFQKFYNLVSPSMPEPDLLLYLHVPVNRLLVNIRKRGRTFEQKLSPDYLFQIQEAYTQWLRQASIPCLVLDLDGADLEQDPGPLPLILESLEKQWNPGRHYLSLG
ncbi:MAG TPA: deoxynucleoside kinase [Chitinophagaceae bacterium]|nr:deoxynucleoside kinase [Chitinophagaceae bacterium]